MAAPPVLQLAPDTLPLSRRRGPGTAVEFALALVKQLYGEEKMREVAGPMVMGPGWDAAI